MTNENISNDVTNINDNNSNEENLTMKDFDNEITNSFNKISEGDIVKATVIAISETEVTVDLNYYTEGIIEIDELSFDPHFSINDDIKVGDVIDAYVLSEDATSGNIMLSKKKADDILAWEVLKQLRADKTELDVKISSTTNGGVISFVEGIRGFIPASLLSANYVEDLSSYVGKTIKVRVNSVDKSNKKLILSAKEIERENKENEKQYKISQLSKDTVTSGKVESIKPYGAFVDIGDGISGLVHISQICEKHIKSPNEVLKVGDTVNVKIISIKDGKVSLSIKACAESEVVVSNEDDLPTEYSSDGDGELSSSIGSLFGDLFK